MKPMIVCLAILGPLYFAGCGTKSQADEQTMEGMLRQYVEARGDQAGIVAGIIDEKQTRIVCDGKTGLTADQRIDGDTVFEIGSVTKVFTSLLLADMVGKGEMKLDDPISKFLPVAVKSPMRDGKEITLIDLATHTSGLPRIPDNLKPKDPYNPYADYTVQQMYDFLSGYTLPRDIGSKYEYSNFGVGLLGHVLELKGGGSFESLVTQRICKPLGMNDTCITLTDDMKSRFAVGHDESGTVVEHWDTPTLAGCGALRSTANDLLKLVAANMGLVKCVLASAMELEQTPRQVADIPNTQIGLAWQITKVGNSEFIWHNGGTYGFSSFIGFDKKRQRGVVVLANCGGHVDAIGLQLLRNSEPPHNHTAVTIDPKIYDDYAGKYQLAPGVEFTVRRDKDRLMVQLTGQPFYEVFPESETNFFYKVVDAQLSFVRNQAGEVASLVLHQGGLDQEAAREK
jgi:D-alanyl-D-alanine-carboxypeptidase/D-alanyl-D-alanine-endopeptidase